MGVEFEPSKTSLPTSSKRIKIVFKLKKKKTTRRNNSDCSSNILCYIVIVNLLSLGAKFQKESV
jgi:hypothetical protein